MRFDAIDDAFHYISNAPPGERSAWVRCSTGRVYLASSKAGFDERPPEAEGDPDYLPIPHRQQIDPGPELVMEFVLEHSPREAQRIEALFARPGAFRNVKDHFRRLGLIESWQVFEAEQIDILLRQWCAVAGLDLD